jgi:hypothetical protein
MEKACRQKIGPGGSLEDNKIDATQDRIGNTPL